MPKASSNAVTPAPADSKPCTYVFPVRDVFTWTSTRHNTCLAMAAEREANSAGDALEQDIIGFQMAPMYIILARDLRNALRRAETDEEQSYALTCFAARCYQAGQYAGNTEWL